MSGPEWMIAAITANAEPRVIAVGQTPRAPKLINDLIRGPRRKTIRAAVDQAVQTKRPVDEVYARDRYRVVAEPFLSPLGRVNAVRVCALPQRSGEDGPAETPQRLPIGAWVWDLNRSVLFLSEQAYDMLKIPSELRRPEMPLVEWISRFGGEVEVPASVISAASIGTDGFMYSAGAAMVRDDGVKRQMHGALWIERSASQIWMHGFTCDMTDDVVEATAPTVSFAQGILDAYRASEDGATAIFNLRNLLPVQWLSDAPKTVQWRRTGDPDRDPAVHPDDIAELLRIGRDVLNGPVQANLRMRGVDGSWVAMHCTGVLMSSLLDHGVRAAMVKMRPISGEASRT